MLFRSAGMNGFAVIMPSGAERIRIVQPVADTFGAIIGLSSALITDDVAKMTPEQKPAHAVAPYGYYRHTFGDLEKLPGSDKDPKFLAKKRMDDGKMPRMFIACGTEDFVYRENLDYHNYLDKIGYPHEWWTKPGIHDYVFWNQSMPAGMEWLKKG